MSSKDSRTTILVKFQELIQNGEMHEYQACLEKAKRLRLVHEVAEAEKQLESRRAEVSDWLKQAVQEWTENRETIEKNMAEAKRLGMDDLITVTEAAFSARAKLVTEGVEIALAQGLKFSFDQWINHAEKMGMEELVARSRAGFLEKVEKTRCVLIKSASSGSREEFFAASEKAKSLAMDEEVARGCNMLRKRVSELLEAVGDIVRSGLSDEKLWDDIRARGKCLGVGWDVIDHLRENVLESGGMNECRGDETSTSTSKGSTVEIVGDVHVPLWSMMQNWKQMELLRLQWQRYMMITERQDKQVEAEVIELDSPAQAESFDNKQNVHILREQADYESDTDETQPSRGDEVLSIPLVLDSLTVEQKMNCSSSELQWLSRIDLNNEGLSELGEGIISQLCPKAKAVSCDMNRLTTLKGAFFGCEHIVEHVSARNNFIADISDIANLPSVESLHLDGNYLSEVPGVAATTGWPRLKELRLSCNRITRLSCLGRQCPGLQVLDLGSNHLITLQNSEGNALANLRSLRMLDVGQNRLKGRSLWDGLKHCPLLISLVASRNRLTELPAFCGSVLLRELWLNGNSIRRLSCSAWMPNLQRLYLQDNSIESLEPLWGCPALEVLDLSFNSISDLNQLRQLACFMHLRSLQLNDNPVSEQPDYVETVLEAVPWLLELDNEAVTERSKNRVVKRIFTSVMRNVGMQYLREKGARGEIVSCYTGKPDEIHRVQVGCDIRTLPWFHRLHHEAVNSGGRKPRSEVPLRTFRDGAADRDRDVLWSALFEVGLFESTRSALRSLVRVSPGEKGLDFSDDMEAKENVFAMQEMCSRQRDKLQLANKDLAVVSRDVEAEVCSCLGLDSSVQLTPAETTRRTSFDGLELCLLQHLRFLGHNTLSRKEVMVRRLQGYFRVHLSKLKLRKSHKAARTIQTAWIRWKVRTFYNTWPDIESKNAGLRLIIKLQAVWRGHIFRQKYRKALARSKYIDEDRFDYGAIDDLQELESGAATIEQLPDLILGPDFSTSDSPTNFSVERGDNFLQIVCDGQASRFPWENDGLPLTTADKDAHDDMQEMKRQQMAQIAEEWGFKDEKTVKQFLKASKKVKKHKANKPAPPTDAQKRLEMFKAKTDIPTEHSQIRQHLDRHLENVMSNMNRRETSKSPAELRKPPRDVVKTIVYPFAVPTH